MQFAGPENCQIRVLAKFRDFFKSRYMLLDLDYQSAAKLTAVWALFMTPAVAAADRRL